MDMFDVSAVGLMACECIRCSVWNQTWCCESIHTHKHTHTQYHISLFNLFMSEYTKHLYNLLKTMIRFDTSQFIASCRNDRQQPSRMHCLEPCPVGTSLSFVDTVPKANHVPRTNTKFSFSESSRPKPSWEITISNIFSRLKEKVSPEELLR